METRGDPEIAFLDPSGAQAWLDAERANLAAATHQAAHLELWQLTVLLACGTVWVLVHRGQVTDVYEIQQIRLAAAHHSGNRVAVGEALVGLGSTCTKAGRWEEAHIAFADAFSVARDLRDPQLQAEALNDRGILSLEQGRYDEAIDHLLDALPLCAGARRGHPVGVLEINLNRIEGFIEANLSRACTGLGRHDQALVHAERSRTLRRQAEDPVGEVYALHLQALASQGIGCHEKAIALCEQALGIGHLFPPASAYTLDTLGTSLRHIGDLTRAESCWREALAIYDRFADPKAADLRWRLRATETSHP